MIICASAIFILIRDKTSFFFPKFEIITKPCCTGSDQDKFGITKPCCPGSDQDDGTRTTTLKLKGIDDVKFAKLYTCGFKYSETEKYTDDIQVNVRGQEMETINEYDYLLGFTCFILPFTVSYSNFHIQIFIFSN